MCLFEMKHLSFTYAEERKRALSDISIKIEEGGFYILCGKSGSGKSTLLRQLKTVLVPAGNQEGKLLFEKTPLEKVSKEIQSREIGFVFQNPEEQIVTDKVWHELAFGLENLGIPHKAIHLRVAEIASYFGIESWFEKSVTELSGGQKQILNLASVLVMQPKVLILDEPMAQLDVMAANNFLHTLIRLHQEMGITILLSEHHLEDIFVYADKIFVMEQGKILLEGSPKEIGTGLAGAGHDLLPAMPTSLRISAQCGEKKNLPVTIAEGRRWLREYYTQNGPGSASAKELIIPKSDNYVVEKINPQKTDRKKDYDAEKTAKNEYSKKNSHSAIELKNVWFHYEKQGAYVLKELSLSVRTGEIFALLGGNGTGKSTLLRLIAGYLPALRGKIFLDGTDIRKKKKEMFRHFLGVLPQDPSVLFVKDTLYEDFLEVAAKEAVKETVEKMQLSEIIQKHPYDLSGGEMQKAAFAKILLLNPKIFLLDEPTKSIDAYAKKEFGEYLSLLKKDGKTILLVSHDIEFCAEYADRLGLYFRGKIEAVSDRVTFFSNHHFYTTAANRMARDLFPKAVTVKDVVHMMKSKNSLE